MKTLEATYIIPNNMMEQKDLSGIQIYYKKIGECRFILSVKNNCSTQLQSAKLASEGNFKFLVKPKKLDLEAGKKGNYLVYICDNFIEGLFFECRIDGEFIQLPISA